MSDENDPVVFLEIEEDDVPELTRVMTRAFDHDTRIHLGQERGGPPGYDDGSFFRKWLFGEDVTVGYKFVVDGKIVGCVIVWIFDHGNNTLGALFVDPDHQGKGLGVRAWQFVEAAYPDTKSWSLDTPAWSTRNRHFYEVKCGFRLDRTEGDFLFYTKDMAKAPAPSA